MPRSKRTGVVTEKSYYKLTLLTTQQISTGNLVLMLIKSIKQACFDQNTNQMFDHAAEQIIQPHQKNGLKILFSLSTLVYCQ